MAMSPKKNSFKHRRSQCCGGAGVDKARFQRSGLYGREIAEDDAPKQIVQHALDRFGRIDFVINNAGLGSPKPLDETDTRCSMNFWA